MDDIELRHGSLEVNPQCVEINVPRLLQVSPATEVVLLHWLQLSCCWSRMLRRTSLVRHNLPPIETCNQ